MKSIQISPRQSRWQRIVSNKPMGIQRKRYYKGGLQVWSSRSLHERGYNLYGWEWEIIENVQRKLTIPIRLKSWGMRGRVRDGPGISGAVINDALISESVDADCVLINSV